jgi:parallel beta-helix repeat protein
MRRMLENPDESRGFLMPDARTRTATAAVLGLALLATLPVTAQAARLGGATHGNVHVVKAGESVQDALDAASPGDTVLLLPGTHVGGVEIRTPDITLRGTGRKTVLVPGDPAEPGRCAATGDGVCVNGTETEPLSGVRISRLAVQGFTGAGIHAVRTTGVRISDTTTTANGTHGISVEYSTGSRVTGNTASDHPQAGVFVAEGDTAGTVVTGNLFTGNRTGVNVRRATHLTVEGNRFTGNCAGVFVVGDETEPPAGSLTIRRNRFVENNLYCPATVRIEHIQGSGIVLTGAAEVTITANLFRGHHGDSPMSGGVVLAPTFKGIHNSGNVVRGNVFADNTPADIVVRDAGEGNVYTDNACSTSEPAGLC